MPRKAYTYRLTPTRKQSAMLHETLERCREVYNAALQERRDAYRMAGKSISYDEQANQLPEIKQIREEYQDIHSQVLQDVLRRVDKTMHAFFAVSSVGTLRAIPVFEVVTAMIVLRIRKQAISLPMIAVSCFPRSAPSKSNGIDPFRAR